ncbi:MAG: hypothetical protein PHZ11_06480 [Desulfitobacteriaceae bacterium]|nr:hypothetical protein [Desulfitobacteriaceae bacterium]MDD4346520.1 hypothetical protein [Desulfitobacteriaceae bacterium]MDD4402060.1 hypothetical protein [Desulfitobacteriaceae bacterium]
MFIKRVFRLLLAVVTIMLITSLFPATPVSAAEGVSRSTSSKKTTQ